MKKFAKGTLKVIHINRKAISENELRVRAMGAAGPRRLVPPVTVWTKLKGAAVKIECFAISKAEMQLRYDTMRFPPGHEFGTPDVRVWLETTDALELAEDYGEFEKIAAEELAKDVAADPELAASLYAAQLAAATTATTKQTKDK